MNPLAEIRTGARLHFGLFDTRSSSGRQGGIGMMIDRPGWHLRASVSEVDEIIGPPEIQTRIGRTLDRLQPARTESGAVRIEVLAAISAHRGLGSGTQLALAISRLLRELSLLESTAESTLDRGRRSLVGTLGFAQGGFVIDPGAQPLLSNPRPRCLPVPEAWRLILIEPTDAATCSGEIESQAFERLPPMTRAIRSRLATLVENDIEPAISQQHFPRFAAGVSEFNQIVGEQFAPSQGGIYAHRCIRELAEVLAETQWPYLAQSSWGAAAALFCEKGDSADRLEEFVARTLDDPAIRITRARPQNHAAEVRGGEGERGG